MHIHIYIYIYMNTYMYVCVYIYIYTYISDQPISQPLGPGHQCEIHWEGDSPWNK